MTLPPTDVRSAATWRGKPTPNPFTSPRPPVEHQPGSWYGDDTVHRRTPTQIREVMDRRVHRWFTKAFDALPDDTTREDLIDAVFGSHGWRVQARVAQPDQRWPMHGWLLTHPDHGIVIYADKTRPGDVDADRLALSRGPWGGTVRLTWGEDLADLLTRVHLGPLVRFPHVRTTQILAAHAYRRADRTDRNTADLLLGLDGYDLPGLLHATAGDDLSVTTVSMEPATASNKDLP